MRKVFGLVIIQIIIAEIIACVLFYTLYKNPGSIDGSTLMLILSIIGIVCIESIALIVITVVDSIKEQKDKNKDIKDD